MSSPDILFKGIPRGPTRGYTAEVIRAFKPEAVVVPCVGSFALPYVASCAGVRPEAIFCSDISLYSTALGHAITGQDWRLDLKTESPKGDGREWGDLVKGYLTDPISKAAAVLFMVRVMQYERKTPKVYLRDLQRELRANAGLYLEDLREQIAGIREKLGGLTYTAQDMWLTIDAHCHNPKALFLTNPPRYDGGYDRMFAGIETVFDWDVPPAKQFREKDYTRLMELAGRSEALTLMYYATQGEDPAPTWGSPWRSVFADRPGNKRVAAINWIVANQDVLDPVASRTKLAQGGAKFPLFTGAVSETSTLQALRVEKPVGDYYRDLFIHKLPGSVTECYVALLLDGFLFGIAGLHLADFRRGRTIKDRRKQGAAIKNFANLTFAFTVAHEKYARLHKLTLLSLVSAWFWRDVLSSEATFEFNGIPASLCTTMLTPHPENKTARGILTMTGREQQPDGTYRLTYTGTVIDRTREETLREWQTKYGTLTK